MTDAADASVDPAVLHRSLYVRDDANREIFVSVKPALSA